MARVLPTRADYDVVHTTEYDYSESVAVSHHVARLNPRALPHQERPAARAADRSGARRDERRTTDYFGNPVTFFAMQGAHKRLTVRARSPVALYRAEPAVAVGHATVGDCRGSDDACRSTSLEFLFDSTSIPIGSRSSSGLRARSLFRRARPLLDGVLDLTRESTTSSRSIRGRRPSRRRWRTSSASRRGVCQDFARLEIACLRSLGCRPGTSAGIWRPCHRPGRRGWSAPTRRTPG